jgi:general secretion pathway protein G
MPSPSRVAGFILLVLILTIGGVIAFVGWSFLRPHRNARRELASLQIAKVSASIDLYRLDNGSYPTTDQGLAALVSAPTSGPLPRRYPPRGYAKDQELIDPWGSPLVYLAPGRVNSSGFDLCSVGSDGQPGGEGPNADICNYGENGWTEPGV